MHRRYFSGALLAALAMIGSLVFATAAPAADHPVGIGITHSLDASDFLMPILALADIAILPAAPSDDTPELVEIADTGPMAPVYRLSWQTDGASLLGFHRRC